MIHASLVFDMWNCGFEVRWPWQNLPRSLRDVQEHFVTSEHGVLWYWLIVAIVVVLLLLVIWRYAHIELPLRRKTSDNPERIFTDLINAVDISDDDRGLLHRLARGARLRHPVMCLLSPGLLEWARQLWLKEKGFGVVTPEITEQLYNISIKLYDHKPVVAGDCTNRHFMVKAGYEDNFRHESANDDSASARFGHSAHYGPGKGIVV
ncbi:MAG: hypothetical protein JW709_07375 [Sedimentisphaerales bacterium]|nr:hypothetical protein [Sedimentisphaerales bacterium]